VYCAIGTIVSEQCVTSTFRADVYIQKLNLFCGTSGCNLSERFSYVEMKSFVFLSAALNGLKNSPYYFILKLTCYLIPAIVTFFWSSGIWQL
jgi:hypothetical protein